MNWFQLLGMIPMMIQMMEQLFPAKGQGDTKRAALIGIVKTAAAAAPEVAADIQAHDIEGAITPIVNATVASMKILGALHPPAVPVAPLPQ